MTIEGPFFMGTLQMIDSQGKFQHWVSTGRVLSSTCVPRGAVGADGPESGWRLPHASHFEGVWCVGFWDEDSREVTEGEAMEWLQAQSECISTLRPPDTMAETEA